MSNIATTTTAEAPTTTTARRGRINLPLHLRGRTTVTHGVEVEATEIAGDDTKWLARGVNLKPTPIKREFVTLYEEESDQES